MGLDAGGQHDHFLTLADDAAGNLAAQAAKVMQRVVGGIVGAVDPLHRKTEGVQVPVAGDVDGFQMLQQGRAVIPWAGLGGFDHVVAVQRAHRDEFHVTEHAELRQKILDLVADFLKAFLLQSTKSILLTAMTRCGMPSNAAM